MPSPIDRQYLDPDIAARIGRLDLLAKVIVAGMRQGLHRSRLRGFSTEFSDFNPYTPGDDLRFLDWRLYARTDRLFVKSFEAETNLELMLMLDATGSMAWRWQKQISKLEFAVNLLAALALLHIQQHDLVGLLVHDAHDLHHLPPRCRREHLEAIFACLEEVKPGDRDSFPALVESLAAFRRHRGQIIICSDLEEDEAGIGGGLQALAGRQDEVILIHLLDQAEVELPFDNLTHLEDSETGELLPVDLPQLKREHAEQLARFRGAWRDRCREAGIVYLPIDTGMDYVDVLFQLEDARRNA